MERRGTTVLDTRRKPRNLDKMLKANLEPVLNDTSMYVEIPVSPTPPSFTHSLCRLQYYNRFANHEQSIKLEQEQYKAAEAKMDEIQRYSSLSWIEVQFYSKAVETLSRCRTVLKWTYAMAFYLEKNNQTQMFEDNQKCVPFSSYSLFLPASQY